MSIKILCPNGHPMRVKDEDAGRIGLCPRCRARVRVPALKHEGDVLRASGEFVHQDLYHDHAIGAAGGSIASTPFPVKKKTTLCIGCGTSVSQSFAICPRCGTPLCKCRHIDVQKGGDAIVVHFIEHQIRDEATIREIAEELCRVAERVERPHLILDFSGVVGVSSMMLGKLVMLQMKLKRSGGDLRLCKLGPEVREVLAATKLDHTLQLEGDSSLQL